MPKKHSHRSGFSNEKRPFKGKTTSKKGGRTAEKKLAGAKFKADNRRAKKNKIVQLRNLKNAKLRARDEKLGNRVPKNVAILTVSQHVNQAQLRSRFLKAVNAMDTTEKGMVEVTQKIGKSNQTFILHFCEFDRLDALDIAKVADIVICVSSPNPSVKVGKIDFDLGFYDEVLELFSLLKAQGIPYVLPLVQGLNRQKPKQRGILLKAYERYFRAEFPKSGKPLSIDSDFEADKMWRMLSIRRHALLEWRHRPYMLAQEINYQPQDDQTGVLSVTGYLRGERALHPNRLVHITGVGEFQIERIEASPVHRQKERGDAGMENTETQILGRPDENQDDLQLIGEIDAFATVNDQSIITDEEIMAAEASNPERNNEARREYLKELGMTDYGMAWDKLVSDEEKEEDAVQLGVPQEAMEEVDPEEMKQQQDKEARDELVWPDEVETPMDTPARERFARYRGLKSFNKSEWDVKENLPLEYSQIVQVDNFPHLVRVIKQNSEGVAANQRVTVVLRNVPRLAAEIWQNKRFLILSGLYQHERKVSVMHYQIQRHPSFEEPIRTKTKLLMQTGFRRFSAQPVWSTDGNGNKHQTEKFFQAGQNMVASVYGQIEITPCPTLVFLPSNENSSTPFERALQAGIFVGSGQVFRADAYRLQIKRKVLTGYPIRAHKRRAVLRYMFFNAEDIRWFKPVELSTRSGLKGRIEEPVGTHGYMKCFFSDTIKSHDVVCMNLYKRQFPVRNPAIFGAVDNEL